MTVKSSYFKESEFFCNCGCGLDFKDIDPAAFRALEIARKNSSIPFIINSSIRCTAHNHWIGGKPTSSHLKGCAFDIKCTNSSDRLKMITAILTSPFTRIGIGKDFIHVDYDQEKPQQLLWIY